MLAGIRSNKLWNKLWNTGQGSTGSPHYDWNSPSALSQSSALCAGKALYPNRSDKRSKRMTARTLSLIALCAALTACNSKPAEPIAASTEAAGETATPAPAPAPAAAMKPAPEGLPSRVAREVITASGQKCEGVAKADRDAKDGSIVASCTSGESYRINTVEGQGPVAPKL